MDRTGDSTMTFKTKANNIDIAISAVVQLTWNNKIYSSYLVTIYCIISFKSLRHEDTNVGL